MRYEVVNPTPKLIKPAVVRNLCAQCTKFRCFDRNQVPACSTERKKFGSCLNRHKM